MKPKLLFLATEDWFVRSHFAPMVARAAQDGFEVVVAARSGLARADLEQLGARVVDLPHARGENSALALGVALASVRRLFRQERPALVHAIAMKPILLASLAMDAAPAAALVMAITGRGHLATSRSVFAGPVRGMMRRLIVGPLRAGPALAVVENAEDKAWLQGLSSLPDDAIVQLPGAGVDAARFAPHAERGEPIRIGVAARLVRSKGVDLVIEAFGHVRAASPTAELHIAGVPDRDNPSSHSVAEVDTWRALPGVTLHGFVHDMARFWSSVHIACLASRGGEGLPRSLIEAAACGRPIVTTDVPGCRDFVEDGVTGLIAPPDDAVGLASALARLAVEPAWRRRMGEAGREKVVAGYTTDHVTAIVSRVWARALSDRAARR